MFQATPRSPMFNGYCQWMFDIFHGLIIIAFMPKSCHILRRMSTLDIWSPPGCFIRGVPENDLGGTSGYHDKTDTSYGQDPIQSHKNTIKSPRNCCFQRHLYTSINHFWHVSPSFFFLNHANHSQVATQSFYSPLAWLQAVEQWSMLSQLNLSVWLPGHAKGATKGSWKMMQWKCLETCYVTCSVTYSITHRIHVCYIYGVPWIPSIYLSHVSINIPAPRIRHGSC